jgi:hypothetical protein
MDYVNSARTTPSYLSKFHFNIIPPSTVSSVISQLTGWQSGEALDLHSGDIEFDTRELKDFSDLPTDTRLDLFKQAVVSVPVKGLFPLCQIRVPVEGHLTSEDFMFLLKIFGQILRYFLHIDLGISLPIHCD